MQLINVPTATTGLVADRILQTNPNNEITSVTDLTAFVLGTTNQFIVTDNGNGTLTGSLPQDIHTGATPQFVGLLLTGASVTTPPGTDLTLSTSDQAVSPGGNILITGSDNPYAGGNVTITAGDITGSSGFILAGNITITAGQVNNGIVSNGGNVSITAGNGGNGEDNLGGNITLTAGVSPALQGGDISLIPGTGGTDGDIIISDFSGLLKGTSGVVSVAAVGTDFDNYWTRTGTVLSPRTAGDGITSTDGITGLTLTSTGRIQNTMAAGDTQGLIIDGTTNPFTYVSGDFTVNSINSKFIGSGTGWPTTNPHLNCLRTLTWDYDFNGTSQIAAGNLISGGDVLTCTGDITINSVGGGALLLNRFDANFSASSFSGIFSNASTKAMSFMYTGGGFYAQMSGSYTVSGGTAGNKNIFTALGGRMTTQGSNPTISSDVNGKLRFNYIGGILEGQKGAGSVFIPPVSTNVHTCYGAIFNATGGDANYAIWTVAGLNVIQGNTRIGSSVDPTVALDVTGAEKLSGELTLGAGTNGITKTTDDLTITTAAQKTVVLATPVYNDLVFPVLQRTTGVGTPTLAAFSGNIRVYQMAVNDVADFNASEIIHDWKEGTQVEIHVHWADGGLNDATVRGVKWEIDYTWANTLAAGGTTAFAAATTVSLEDVIAANEPDKTSHVIDVVTFTPTGGKVGAQLLVSLKRIASVTNVAPAADPWILGLGVHYQIDTIGSRQELVK